LLLIIGRSLLVGLSGPLIGVFDGLTPRSFRVDEAMVAQNHTLEQCLAQYCSTNIGDKLTEFVSIR
jgi:hypothetical protein